MAFQPEPEQPKPGFVERFMGLVILAVILLLTVLLMVVGYMMNTIWDYNLGISSLFSKLPLAAQNAFNIQQSYTLDAYAFIPSVIVVIAIGATVAAVFGRRAQHEDIEEAQY